MSSVVVSLIYQQTRYALIFIRASLYKYARIYVYINTCTYIVYTETFSRVSSRVDAYKAAAPRSAPDTGPPKSIPAHQLGLRSSSSSRRRCSSSSGTGSSSGSRSIVVVVFLSLTWHTCGSTAGQLVRLTGVYTTQARAESAAETTDIQMYNTNKNHE